MGAAQFRTQFRRFGHWIALSAAALMLTMVSTGLVIPGSNSAASAASQTQSIAWHGPGFAQTYMGPIFGRPVYNHTGYNRGYGPIYGPGYNTTPFYRPLHNGGGGVVVIPNAHVYW